jgi:hypothetical protein
MLRRAASVYTGANNRDIKCRSVQIPLIYNHHRTEIRPKGSLDKSRNIIQSLQFTSQLLYSMR